MAALEVEGYKKCNRCGLDKWLSEFSPHAKAKDGRQPTCIECRRLDSRKSARKLREADRPAYNEYHREYGKGWRKDRPKTTRSRLLSDL